MTRQGTRRLDSLGCSEQGKLPTAKAFTLAERDKDMSEQKQSFMQRLDEWADEAVIGPLAEHAKEAISLETQLQVRQAIRQKVLESYRNGQAAGDKPARKEWRGHAKA